MNKKQILDRAYMAKVLTKSTMRSNIEKTIEDMNHADALNRVVEVALDCYYKLFQEEIEDALKEAED